MRGEGLRLTVAEYQHLCAVLRRDAALRARERQRAASASSAPAGGAGVEQEILVNADTCSCRGGEVKQQSEEWLFRQVQRRLHLQPAAATCICSADDGVGMEPETAHVREFIERLVESLVSGELDNVCIKRLHSHAEYDRMFACHHGPLCEALARLSFALQMAMANKHMAGHDSPSAAHAALKQLIHQIIQEAMALPKFKGVKPVNDMKSWEDMSSKTYEDILATAILNKVIERYQQSGSVARGSMDGNSNLLSPELMSLVAMHQPKQLTSGESGLHSPKEMNDHRYFLNDGDTLSELSNTDPLSVTIEECIEEVTTFSNAEDDDAGDSDSGIPGLNVFKKRRAPFPEYGRDIIDGPPIDVSDDGEEDEEQEESEDEASLQPTDVINPVDSWEENWLFQKRRLRVGGVQQPMPVPMLVPNPSEDYRALIGDRDAEDVSDLSDCSDGALEDLVLAEDSVTTPDREVIPPSDMGAADKNLVENGVHGSNIGSLELKGTNTQNNLGIAEKPLIVLNDADQELSDDVSDLTEAKNMEYLKANSDDCMSEFGQQEGEYTEDYAAVTQRCQMDSLTETSDADSQEVPELPSTPVPQLSSETSSTESVAAILDSLAPGELIPQESSDLEVINNDLVQPPRPGTIAEREHKKWETAPPLPNNPYSPENIIKRLNKKHTFVRTNSGSDASIEFPELKEVDSKEKVSPPLQVVCSPSDVDCKRYGRDYYINAEPMINGKKRQSSSESYNPEVSDATLLSVAKLEKQILIRDVYHSSFRARNASPQFKMNPLYETDKENFISMKETPKDNCMVLFQDDQKSEVKCDAVHNSLDFEMSITNPEEPPIRTNPLYSQNFENSQQDSNYVSPNNELMDYTKVPADEAPQSPGQYCQRREKLDNLRNTYQINQKRENSYTESGYSSSLDSLHDPSLFLLRLTPPTQPQVIERSFESLSSIRRSGSLRVGARKRKAVLPPTMGGSLRICRRQHALAKDLW